MCEGAVMVTETAWVECVVNLRVRRWLFQREVVPFRVRYRICQFGTLVHTYVPRVKRIVEPCEYAAFVAALAHMTDGGVTDNEPVLLVLAIVTEERFRTLYDRPALFLHREVTLPLALIVEGVAGERLDHHVVMVDEQLFALLEPAHVPSEPVAVYV